MRVRKIMCVVAVAACAVIGAGVPAAAWAAELSGVRASGCWVRTMPATLPSSGYFTLKNDGDRPVALKGVETRVFGRVMMHQTRSNGSTSKMVHVDSVVVPAHGTLQFAPGGYHVMLEQPRDELTFGTTIPLTLDFGARGKLEVPCELKPASTSH